MLFVHKIYIAVMLNRVKTHDTNVRSVQTLVVPQVIPTTIDGYEL